MEWIKLGQVFSPVGKHQLLLTHASNPLAIYIEDNIYRVFYSGRDIDNRSSVSFVDIDIIDQKIIHQCTTPVFSFGQKESFYSHGVSIGNMYSIDSQQYILFMGWQIRNQDHWRGDIGRLKLINKEKLELDGKSYFMSTDVEDPISLSYPWVTFHEGIYKMWYGSTITWQTDNGEMLHVIKYATSNDGHHWKKHGLAIPYKLGVAQAFSRPSIIIDNEGYHMWFSYRSGRGEKYRIGYSKSLDGVNWKNELRNPGIDVSSTGWDSEMICYPFIFDHRGRRYMLYNGNGYGKTGFGLAILKE